MNSTDTNLKSVLQSEYENVKLHNKLGGSI